MDAYKRIIKSRRLRLKILGCLEFIPDSIMLRIQYRIKMGKALSLNNPKKYSEKIQWYKLNYRNTNLVNCVDKYDVRDYISKLGYNSILNECYGVFENPEEINLDLLPERFVIKDTLGGGGNDIFIVDDKKNCDFNAIKNQAKKWISVPSDKKSGGREWPYYSGKKHRIIIEKYLQENDGDLKDYKFFCFNGKVEYVVYDCDRFVGHKRNFYDSQWNYIDVETDNPKYGDIVEKPLDFEKMKKIAEDISKEFPHVRVDMYYVNGNIFFGELTFFPWSGYIKFNPESFDYIIGENFDLNTVKNK